MIKVIGNIWDWLDRDTRIVIPVNIGWKSDGTNVMGAGLAREAAQRYPGLPFWWGQTCKTLKEKTPVMIYSPQPTIILFPTKPLNPEKPYLSWKQKASLELIERSAQQLARIEGRIALPMVGCGNGALDPKKVEPILQKYLSEDRFTLVLTTSTI